jgi:hypothetical protein
MGQADPQFLIHWPSFLFLSNVAKGAGLRRAEVEMISKDKRTESRFSICVTGEVVQKWDREGWEEGG